MIERWCETEEKRKGERDRQIKGQTDGQGGEEEKEKDTLTGKTLQIKLEP